MIPVFIHFPQITYSNMQFDTRPQLPCRQLCPEQNAEISPAKVQCSWKTATQNNCSRINAVLGHWTYGGSRSSFNPLPKIISFLELIPFSHSSEEPCPGWSRDNHVGSGSTSAHSLVSRKWLYPPKGCMGASW